MENNNSEYGYARALSYSRAIAEVFYAVTRKRCPLDREIKSYFRRHKECGPRDRSLITESLFSLFRWYGWTRGKLPKERPENPLRSKKFCAGLSAALWLDNQPFAQFMEILYDAAGVNAVGVKNSPDLIGGKIKGLSYFFRIRKRDVFSLVPEWFKKEVADDDLATIIESLQKRPPVWIRVQNNSQEAVLKEFGGLGIDLSRPEMKLFAASNGVSIWDSFRKSFIPEMRYPQCRHRGIASEMISNAFKLSPGKFNVKGIASYQKGLFEIQDLASQCLGLACGAHGDQAWWDVCAGAGGKSLLLADQMRGKGKVVATDKRADVLKELQKRAARAHFKNIQIADLDKVVLSRASFDGVLVDAPCSCTGIWRRNPDLRWTSGEDICGQSAVVQKEILGFACGKVKAGGLLVYATCSLSTQENEGVVKHFLKLFPEFVLENFIHPLTGKFGGGMMRVKFNSDDCDAAFAARFRKR